MENSLTHQSASETFLENVSVSCSKIMDSDSNIKLQTTNAQELYNHFQVFK